MISFVDAETLKELIKFMKKERMTKFSGLGYSIELDLDPPEVKEVEPPPRVADKPIILQDSWKKISVPKTQFVPRAPLDVAGMKWFGHPGCQAAKAKELAEDKPSTFVPTPGMRRRSRHWYPRLTQQQVDAVLDRCALGELNHDISLQTKATSATTVHKMRLQRYGQIGQSLGAKVSDWFARHPGADTREIFVPTAEVKK